MEKVQTRAPLFSSLLHITSSIHRVHLNPQQVQLSSLLPILYHTHLPLSLQITSPQRVPCPKPKQTDHLKLTSKPPIYNLSSPHPNHFQHLPHLHLPSSTPPSQNPNPNPHPTPTLLDHNSKKPTKTWNERDKLLRIYCRNLSNHAPSVSTLKPSSSMMTG